MSRMSSRPLHTGAGLFRAVPKGKRISLPGWFAWKVNKRLNLGQPCHPGVGVNVPGSSLYPGIMTKATGEPAMVYSWRRPAHYHLSGMKGQPGHVEAHRQAYE